jgi:hypothetical protein
LFACADSLAGFIQRSKGNCLFAFSATNQYTPTGLRSRSASEFDAEVQMHLQLLTEKFVRRGMSPEDADSAARRQFGNTTLVRQP